MPVALCNINRPVAVEVISEWIFYYPAGMECYFKDGGKTACKKEAIRKK